LKREGCFSRQRAQAATETSPNPDAWTCPKAAQDASTIVSARIKSGFVWAQARVPSVAGAGSSPSFSTGTFFFRIKSAMAHVAPADAPLRFGGVSAASHASRRSRPRVRPRKGPRGEVEETLLHASQPPVTARPTPPPPRRGSPAAVAATSRSASRAAPAPPSRARQSGAAARRR
jgi:hypothetical protein